LGQPQKSVQLKFLVAKKETKPIEGIIFSSDLLTDEGCLDDEPPKLVSAYANSYQSEIQDGVTLKIMYFFGRLAFHIFISFLPSLK